MSNRVTIKHLQTLCDNLNRLTGSPMTYWDESSERRCTNIGHYHISQAYGGCELVRTCSAGGGVSDVLRTGHVSKRECADAIRHYMAALEDVRYGAVKLEAA